MESPPLLFILLALFTLLILFAGIFVMAKGGKINKKYSNKLMVARVVMQFGAVVVLFLMFLISR